MTLQILPDRLLRDCIQAELLPFAVRQDGRKLLVAEGGDHALQKNAVRVPGNSTGT
jgi:hypothetical protein